MTKQEKKIGLWIAFAALWFVIWFGMKYFLHASFDLWEGIIFFVIFGVLDKHGVSWIVDKYMEDPKDESDEEA